MSTPPTQTSPLALDGGQPLRTDAWPPWPHFDEEMLEVTANVLKSGRVNYWTGQESRLFEQEFADFVGTQHAIALANGTVALELALYACGVGPGDEVIVPSRTFIATASAAAMRGACPIVCDLDPVSQNMTAETIQAVLTPQTKAIIAVHLAGWPCDMDPILELARPLGITVIEDCAQAHGATYKGRPIGSLGDLAAFSFCQDKILTTGGEGGMLTTNDTSMWNTAWSFKDHGKSWDAIYHTPNTGVFKLVHEEFGTNWRLTEIQSAIGRVMLRRLPGWVEQRRKHAAILNAGLSAIEGIQVPLPGPEFGHSYYKHYAFVEPEMLRDGWSRDRILQAIQAEGIPVGSGSCAEIYLEKAFSRTTNGPHRTLPVARRLGELSLMFQVHPTLSAREMEQTCAVVRKVMAEAVAPQAQQHQRAA